MIALELKNLSKTFGDCRAYSQINLQVFRGEVHAILGENGAGKSTLMKTIFGIHQPDPGGEIFLNGDKINISSPRFAIECGIGMVHQHFKLIRPFTILQNIILGVEPKKFGCLIDYDVARSEVLKISKDYNFDLDLDLKIENISVGMQQRVEIVKTLYRNADLIILDEPTAVLTPQEVQDFYRIVTNLKREGKTIIIITHKLHEIKEIADRCTIIRKGEYIDTVDVKKISEAELASKMVGREVNFKIDKNKQTLGNIVLKVSDLEVHNDKNLLALNKFSFQISQGEILGLAGIDGNGQKELVEAMTGLRPVKSGKIFLNEKNITNLPPKEIYDDKMSMIPEDRQLRGLVMDFSVQENLVLQTIDQKPFSHYGFILTRELKKFADSLLERFDIRPRNPQLKASALSGGNQQKIILAREIYNKKKMEK
jgi:simple sugar transport system ATP-binding protein